MIAFDSSGTAYRGDGGYDMGELLSAVIGRQGDLLKQATKAAKSWGNDTEMTRVQSFQEERAKKVACRDSRCFFRSEQSFVAGIGKPVHTARIVSAEIAGFHLNRFIRCQKISIAGVGKPVHAGRIIIRI